jgi:hypothetical protein
MAKMTTLPETQVDRIVLVGKTLFGDDFHRQTAEGLGIHRATLWRWLTGNDNRIKNVDAELLSLLELERERSSARSARIAALQKLFLVRIREAANA